MSFGFIRAKQLFNHPSCRTLPAACHRCSSFTKAGRFSISVC